MEIDPRRLRLAEAVRLLNSVSDEPLAARRVREAFDRLGARVCAAGDLSRIDLVKLAGHLALQRHRRIAEAKVRSAAEGASPQLSGYELLKDREAKRRRELSLSGRDIGEMPAIVDPARRARCAESLAAFCTEYFPELFTWPWSDDHLRVIAKLEQAIRFGALFAIAMPRGSGKSSLCRVACMWALLYGYRRFVVLIGSNERHAGGELESIQTQLESNDVLLADFPEVCFPIRALEGIRQRANGQLYRGSTTAMRWSSDRIVLPTIDGSSASGGVIAAVGLTGQLRGMNHTTRDGENIRPDLAVLDDPQTDESARSPSQCAYREALILGAVLGLPGPGTRISAVATVTVVQRDDLADNLLRADRHPQWQGERCQMLKSMPTNSDAWDEYAKVRRTSLEGGMTPEAVAAACTAWYDEHRAKLEEGARVSWEARIVPGDRTALQTAMNVLLDRGPEIFWAEYQNDPGALQDQTDEGLKPEDVMAKILATVPRGVVPLGSEHVTSFIDVQGKVLFWMVCAWTGNMTGCIVDYGTWPDQKLPYFTLRQAKRTIQSLFPGKGQEASIRAALSACTEELHGRAWRVDGGGELRIGRGLIDAGWGDTSDMVYEFCRSSPHAAVLMPSKGVGITANKAPIGEWQKAPGDRLGLNWKIPAMVGRRHCRHVLFDANWWKTTVAARLRTSYGDPGAMYVSGGDAKQHRMLIDHLMSERAEQMQGPTRSIMQWSLKSVGRDNHWWDCLVGCAVAANVLNPTCVPPGLAGAGVRPRRKVSVPPGGRAR